MGKIGIFFALAIAALLQVETVSGRVAPLRRQRRAIIATDPKTFVDRHNTARAAVGASNMYAVVCRTFKNFHYFEHFQMQDVFF